MWWLDGVPPPRARRMGRGGRWSGPVAGRRCRRTSGIEDGGMLTPGGGPRQPTGLRLETQMTCSDRCARLRRSDPSLPEDPGHVRQRDHVHLLLQRQVGRRRRAAMTSHTNAAWLANTIFDGAQWFRGLDQPRLALPARSALGAGPAPADDVAARRMRTAPARASPTRPTPRSTSGQCSRPRAGLVLPDFLNQFRYVIIRELGHPDPAKGFFGVSRTYDRPEPRARPLLRQGRLSLSARRLAIAEAKDSSSTTP